MGDTVQMPDGTLVEMPDNPTPQQIAALRRVAETGNLKEIGRTTDKAVRGGLTAFPGFMGDVGLAAARNPDKLPWMMRVPMELTRQIPGVANAIDNTKFGDVTNTIQTFGGAAPPISQPQTELGKTVGNVGESTVAALTGGGAASAWQKATMGFWGGMGGEGAARTLGDGPVQRILGAMLGSGAAAKAQGMFPNAVEAIQKGNSSMTKQDWSYAEGMKKVLEKLGLPHLNSQLLGPRSIMPDWMFHASGNQNARPAIKSHLAKVADKAEKQLDDKSELMVRLPVNMNSSSSAALDEVQQAAGKKITSLREGADKAFETGMPSGSYTQDHIRRLHDDLVALAHSSKFGETSSAGKSILRFAGQLKDPKGEASLKAALKTDDPMNALGNAKEYVDDMQKISNLLRGKSMHEVSPSGWDTSAKDAIRERVKAFTPEFNASRQAKADYMKNEYEPVAKSLTGKIAAMGGGNQPDKMTASPAMLDLFSKAAPVEIEMLGKNLGGDAVGTLLREHIQRSMRQSWEDGAKSGMHDTAKLSNLYANLYGTREKRQAMDTAMRVYLDNGTMQTDPKVRAEIIKGFRHVLNGLETYKNVHLNPGISSAQSLDQTAKGVLRTAIAPIRSVFVGLGASNTDQTYKQMTEIMLSPNGLKIMQQIGNSPKPDRIRTAAMAILAQGQEGANATGLYPNNPPGE